MTQKPWLHRIVYEFTYYRPNGGIAECKVTNTPLLGCGYHAVIYVLNSAIAAFVFENEPSVGQLVDLCEKYIDGDPNLPGRLKGDN